MFEWLWSKMLVVMAAFLLLWSVSAYFVNQREDLRLQELRTVARNLAYFIDGALDAPGTATFIVGPDDNANFALPRLMQDAPYGLQLRQDSVIVSSSHGTAIGRWAGQLHFWHWDGTPLDAARIREFDDAHQSLSIESSQSWRISLEEVTFRGSTVLLAFSALCS